MNKEQLLAYTPVGVRKLRKTDSQLSVENGLIIRKTSTCDIELPQAVWDDLLSNDQFNKAWLLVKDARTARQEAKKQALAEADKATLLKHAELFKTIMQ